MLCEKLYWAAMYALGHWGITDWIMIDSLKVLDHLACHAAISKRSFVFTFIKVFEIVLKFVDGNLSITLN